MILGWGHLIRVQWTLSIPFASPIPHSPSMSIAMNSGMNTITYAYVVIDPIWFPQMLDLFFMLSRRIFSPIRRPVQGPRKEEGQAGVLLCYNSSSYSIGFYNAATSVLASYIGIQCCCICQLYEKALLLLLLLLLLILYIDFLQMHSRHRQTHIFSHCFKQSE